VRDHDGLVGAGQVEHAEELVAEVGAQPPEVLPPVIADRAHRRCPGRILEGAK
jgi:hypothetical protein